jgi:PAB-dependent poly(A)-specific ribonuclease subunit 3
MSSAVDRLEGELMSELENARLVRLLCKFGFINERPEWVALFLLLNHAKLIGCRFARDPRWSETGDRYIVKLFRDYVFHQVDENGNPVVNLSHVLACLNKVGNWLVAAFLFDQVIFALVSSWTRVQTNVSCSSRETSRVVLL